MASTPTRRSTAAPPDPSFPPQPQQGHLAQARMAVSRAMADVPTDDLNYQKKGCLSLRGTYAALAEPLAQNSLALSSALVFVPEANLFVARTTVASMVTGESDFSDFPIADMGKRDNVAGDMTFGIRQNCRGLFSFHADDENSATPTPAGGSFAGTPGGYTRPGYARPVQAAPAPSPLPPTAPPQFPQYHPPAQTGLQRNEPLAQPAYDPSTVPPILSESLPY